MISRYQAKYYAKMLTLQSMGDSIDTLSQSLLSATVDINPHQIEAALFAFRSPLSKGVLLADEVGLGKTIEAGLVLCQYWAVGKRKLLIICPASLRKQWSYELSEKFGLENIILDTKNVKENINSGIFLTKKISICSYQFAAKYGENIIKTGFDLAVIDEAHKLRNVNKTSSKNARKIRSALKDTKKILLTATPFQNSLAELHGLASIIDENIFGEYSLFRSSYTKEENLPELKELMSRFYKRTLRKDVQEYINFTKRLPITQKFVSTDLEQKLYDNLSEFLRREKLYAIPNAQKNLITMVTRKIMASSSYAIIGTLETIINRLKSLLAPTPPKQLDLLEDLNLEEDMFAGDLPKEEKQEKEPDPQKNIDRKAVEEEIFILSSYIDLAKKISTDSKAAALLKTLSSAFIQVKNNGANKKALIFTESTRTQSYLKKLLSENGYNNKIVLFNGSNTYQESNTIYDEWLKKNEHTGHISGIKAADRRMALVEYFRDSAEIMIATEAAAEGLNLQFCSFIVNYDLPWNPQLIEQRIGRCHRYGQKHDVVVLNFINSRNYADNRAYDLLQQKFHLFDSVFGTSDEILGQLQDSADFEKQVWKIYQECRTEQEIETAFDHLKESLQPQIDKKMNETKEAILNNFDINVQERLRVCKDNTDRFLYKYEYMFWELTKFILKDDAVFDDQSHSFQLKHSIFGCGDHHRKYYLRSDNPNGEVYRLSHPLAEYVIQQALKLPDQLGALRLMPDNTPVNITIPDEYRHTSGFLSLEYVTVKSLAEEQFLLFSAHSNSGKWLPQELCERLFLLAGEDCPFEDLKIAKKEISLLKANAEQARQSQLLRIDDHNKAFCKEEEDRIFRIAKNITDSIEKEIQDIKNKIEQVEREIRRASDLGEKESLLQKLEKWEAKKRNKRIELAEKEDETIKQRKNYLAELDKRMRKDIHHTPFFLLHWEID